MYVDVWNPTVANLTLMAFGSSAPEIFLSVLSTVGTLGSKPDELGAATIVGSAAFNFLVITAVSILSVKPENDERTKKQMEEDGTAKGIKKINELGVFAITTTFSVFAYIWLYYVLSDSIVEPWEGWTTFILFFVLIFSAYFVDCLRAKKIKEVEVAKFGNMEHMTMVDFYEKLIPLEQGQEPVDADE